MAFVYYPQVDTFMQERVDAYTPDAAEPDDIFNKEFVDQLQKSFKCCGWKGADDFTGQKTILSNAIGGITHAFIV